MGNGSVQTRSTGPQKYTKLYYSLGNYGYWDDFVQRPIVPEKGPTSPGTGS